MSSLELASQAVQELGEPLSFQAVRVGKPFDRFGQGFDSPPTAFLKDFGPFCGRFEASAAFVVGWLTLNEAGPLEAGDDPAHGGRLDLLGFSQFAERTRTAEHQDGECRELGGADSGFRVADAQAAQQVDGGRMQPVCYLQGIVGRGLR